MNELSSRLREANDAKLEPTLTYTSGIFYLYASDGHCPRTMNDPHATSPPSDLHRFSSEFPVPCSTSGRGLASRIRPPGKPLPLRRIPAAASSLTPRSSPRSLPRRPQSTAEASWLPRPPHLLRGYPRLRQNPRPAPRGRRLHSTSGNPIP